MKSPLPDRPSTLAAIASVLAAFALPCPLPAQTAAPASVPANSADSDQAVLLNPFEVSASSNVGYGAETSSSSGRIVQAYIDVPQTVNVITNQFMQDFDIDNSREALATVPGVLLGGAINNGTNMIRGVSVNAFYVDGLQGSAGSTVAAQSGAGGSMVMPTIFYDRIEVVKGPSSAAYGVGESGGIINYIPKTPQGITNTEVTVGVGDYSNYMASVDTQGRINDKLQYRLVLDDESGASPIWYVHTFTTAAQLALKYQPTPDTTVQWITSFERFETPAFNTDAGYRPEASSQLYNTIPVAGYTYNPASFPTTGGIPGGLPFGFIPKDDPGFPEGWNSDINQAFRSELNVVHNFGPVASVRDAVAIDNTQQQQHIMTGPGALTAYNPNGSTFGLSPGQYGYTVTPIDWPISSRGVRDALDVNAVADILGARFTTTAGGEIYQTWNWEDFRVSPDRNAAGQLIYVNPYNPGEIGDYNQYINPVGDDAFFPTIGAWDSEVTKGYGFYVQEQASFFSNRLTVLGGWRKDFLDQSDTTLPSGTETVTGWNNNKGAPRAAITVKPVKWLSLYSLYTKHADPEKETNKWIIEGSGIPASVIPDPAALITYAPQGVLFEEGAKASLFDGRLTASAAIYHDITSGTILDVPNAYVPTSGPNAGLSQAYAENEVTGTNIHGFEASVTGAVTNRLTFTAGYSDTKGSQPAILTGTDEHGAYVISVAKSIEPPDIANFFGRYDFGDGRGNGLYLTLGVDAFSPFIPINTADVVDWSGKLWTFQITDWQYEADAGAGYRWAHGRQKVAVSCTNLTNQWVYLGSAGSGNFANLAGRQIWFKYSISY